MQKTYFFILAIFNLLLHVNTMHANIVWPAMFIGEWLVSSIFVIILSLIIEGLILYIFLKGISYAKAMLMSCIGNGASLILGSIIIGLSMILWHLFFDEIIGLGSFHIYNWIVSWILMYIGSALIELLTLKLFFRYTAKQLFLPVFIGNSVTYALTLLKVILTTYFVT